MPTQEERLLALEQATTVAQRFQRETAAHIRETEENTTILLGVIRDQGRDIKRIVERLDVVDTHLDTVGTRLDHLETKIDTIQSTLALILERLPEKS